MGRINIGHKDKSLAVMVEPSASAEVIYVDRPVDRLVEIDRIVEVIVDRPVEQMIHVERLVEAPAQIIEKIVHVDNPELLKRVEAAEYASIQKDLDYSKLKENLDFALEERETDVRSLVRSRSQHIISLKHKDSLMKKLRDERKKSKKLALQMKMVVAASVVLSLIALMWH